MISRRKLLLAGLAAPAVLPFHALAATFATPCDSNVAYSVQNGRYVKVGKLVMVQAKIVLQLQEVAS